MGLTISPKHPPTHTYVHDLTPSLSFPFLPSLRLFLLKSVIDTCFDLDKFKEHGLLAAFTALHDANRGEKINIDYLTRRWVSFWMASSLDAGSALVSSPSYEEDVEIWFFERPFAQPLIAVREYF